MRKSFAFIILTIFFLFFSCSEKTPEEIFYFEIKTHQNDKFNNNLSKFLIDQIPQKKYTITNSSGLTWPYYAAIDLDKTISIDSLMPPHWYLHKMIYKHENSISKVGDHFVQIDLMPKVDTVLNYSVTIYKVDSTGLTSTATTGIHYIDSTKFPSNNMLSEYYLQSIIRYSFK